MPIKLANNASGTLATAISASDTGIALTTGDGAEFPTLSAGDYFYATITSSQGTQEIVRVNARSGDSLTVVRAQEGTTAAGFAAGARFELRVTAQSVFDAVGDVVASQVGFTPTGGIAATDVQAALAEVDTEKVAFTRLDDNDGSSLVGFLQAGTNAVPTTVQAKLRETVSVKDFGAVGDGVTDDTAAIQAAITSLASTGGTVFFPRGTYKTDAGVTLVSNLTLQGAGGAVLKPSDSVPLWAYRGVSTNNVKVKDLVFEGTGNAFTDGSQQLLQLASSVGVEISGCTFTKARITALVIETCDTVQISNCNFNRNYYYGAEVRDSANTATDSCTFELNGDTGSATTAFGRGFVFWRTSNSTLSNCVFNQNTEYGLRLFSQSGDATANRNITITGCSFRDNGTTATGKNDLYVYDDAKLTERVVISGCTFSTRTGNFAAVLSGREISLSGCVFKAITPQSGNGISLFGSTNVVVTGNVFQGFFAVASFSATAGNVSTNCTLSNNQCIDVGTFATLQGSGHIISNNYIKKGGVSATTVGITITSANIDAAILGNTLDGFYRGILMSSTGGYIRLQNNTTLNSTDVGLYALAQTDVSRVICTNNAFDSSYPTVWSSMFSDGAAFFSRKQWVLNGDPAAAGVGGGANIVWKVGDRVFNSNAAIGSPKSWVCTVAGAPGTWTSEGNL